MARNTSKDQILNEIKRLASEVGDKPPGAAKFESLTGIRKSEWLGRYWSRWGDAIVEAGLEPNEKQRKLDADKVMLAFAESCRRWERMPTYA